MGKRKTTVPIQDTDVPSTEQEAEATPRAAPGSENARLDTPDAADENGTSEASEEASSAESTGDVAAAESPEDEVTEEPASETEEEDTAARIAELEDRLLRALAETENVRRRAAKERDDVSKYAITAFTRDLLPAIDNLRRAIDNVPDKLRTDDGLAGLVDGIEMTERELLSAFDRHGIRRIDPLGEKFDPNLHQAMFEVEDSDREAGTVVQVMQVGYVLGDRLLRPAMVGVAKDPEPTEHVDTEA